MVNKNLGKWRCLAASVMGTSHISQGRPCQDANATVVTDDGSLIVAVADGAGSAKRAEEGSQCVVQCATKYLREKLADSKPQSIEQCEELIREAFRRARSGLEEIAPGENLDDVATTLLLTVVTDGWLSTIQIGDGAVVCRTPSGAIRVLSKLGDHEYLNETTFLTSPDYQRYLHIVTVPSEEISGLAMLTDGIELLAIRYADNTGHEPFFRSVFEFTENIVSTDGELADFLASERVCERTDDDKTLVLAVRHASN
jgi:serine/threonine protein phosphatase PrpC